MVASSVEIIKKNERGKAVLGERDMNRDVVVRVFLELFTKVKQGVEM